MNGNLFWRWNNEVKWFFTLYENIFRAKKPVLDRISYRMVLPYIQNTTFSYFFKILSHFIFTTFLSWYEKNIFLLFSSSSWNLHNNFSFYSLTPSLFPHIVKEVTSICLPVFAMFSRFVHDCIDFSSLLICLFLQRLHLFNTHSLFSTVEMLFFFILFIPAFFCDSASWSPRRFLVLLNQDDDASQWKCVIIILFSWLSLSHCVYFHLIDLHIYCYFTFSMVIVCERASCEWLISFKNCYSREMKNSIHFRIYISSSSHKICVHSLHRLVCYAKI